VGGVRLLCLVGTDVICEHPGFDSQRPNSSFNMLFLLPCEWAPMDTEKFDLNRMGTLKSIQLAEDTVGRLLLAVREKIETTLQEIWIRLHLGRRSGPLKP
jgi:hypothetical protein